MQKYTISDEQQLGLDSFFIGIDFVDNQINGLYLTEDYEDVEIDTLYNWNGEEYIKVTDLGENECLPDIIKSQDDFDKMIELIQYGLI